MFEENSGKSTFLQKKKQQKKKQQQQVSENNKTTLIQKVVRSFLSRRQLEKKYLQDMNVQGLLFIRADDFENWDSHSNNIGTNQKEISQRLKHQTSLMLESIRQLQRIQKSDDRINLYCQRLIVKGLESSKQQTIEESYRLLEALLGKETTSDLNRKFDFLFRSKRFLSAIDNKMHQEQFPPSRLLNIILPYLLDTRQVDRIAISQLAKIAVGAFGAGKQSKMQIESPHTEKFTQSTLILLFSHLSIKNTNLVESVNMCFSDIQGIGRALRYFIGLSLQKQINSFSIVNMLLKAVLQLIVSAHKNIVAELTKQFHHLYVLIADMEDLEYFENKIVKHQKMQNFSNTVLQLMEGVFGSSFITETFLGLKKQEQLGEPKDSIGDKELKHTILECVRILRNLFEDRKLLFLRDLLSSDELLQKLKGDKPFEFYEGLKMKLLTMDDIQFKEFNIFTVNQWKAVIHTAISNCWKLLETNKLLLSGQSMMGSKTVKQFIPFETRANDSVMALNSYSETIENLYKKSLRTKKIPEEYFISHELSAFFEKFDKFGSGNIEKMLKLFPYCFTFESRMKKFKALIKADKLNHDRSLFLLEDVDEDLIITVRRGKQFMDAFDACMHRDLRKKYKIIFYNEQGLEEEGIDGGGLIKEFINRVLTSAFSQMYGLFQETPANEIIPNPYSPQTFEYEFVGKLIGKAIYEGITIEQKFAEPFLNLLIGRKNTFQDLQYLDEGIYKGLLDIKRMSEEEVEDLQQTWVILDQQPNGFKKLIDLSKQSKELSNSLQEQENVMITSATKLRFILEYSDFKCNKQLAEKTRLFRKGFLTVMKPEWLTLFNNQELNRIISGGEVDFPVWKLRESCVYVEYHEKSVTIKHFWEVLEEFSALEKSKFLLYVTSCSRPPTMGFSSMKPKICISRDHNVDHLPTANTCMNVLRLPDYQNKDMLREKLLYAITSKAGFEFA